MSNIIKEDNKSTNRNTFVYNPVKSNTYTHLQRGVDPVSQNNNLNRVKTIKFQSMSKDEVLFEYH